MGKSNAQDNKETAAAAKGLPEEQASKAQADLTASPNGIEPFQLTPTNKFVHPRHPEQVMTGDQLWQSANKGFGYDKLLIQFQKAAERNTLLEKQIEQNNATQSNRDIDARIAQRVQEMLPQQQPQAAPQDADDSLSQWVTDPEGSTPAQSVAIDSDKIVAGLAAINAEKDQKLLANIDKMVDERLNTMFNNRVEQENKGKQQTAWLQKIRAAKERNLKQQFPDVSDEVIAEAIELEDAAAYDQLKALAMSEDGNDAGAMDTVINAEERRQKAMDLRVNMKVAQDQATTKAQAAAELEGASMGIIPGEDIDAAPPEYNRFKNEDVKKHHESIMERAKKLVGITDAADNALP